jgi:hypothetical protein
LGFFSIQENDQTKDPNQYKDTNGSH